MGSSETGVGYISFSYKVITVMMQMMGKENFFGKRAMRKVSKYETATKSC